MLLTLKEELQVKQLSLGYPKPDVFVQSQWSFPRWLYILWRAFWCLWFLSWVVASGVRAHEVHESESGKWFVYYSHLTALLTVATCLLDFSIAFYIYVTRGGSVLYDNDSVDLYSSGTGLKQTDKEEILFHGSMYLDEGIKEYTTPSYLRILWLFYSVISAPNIIVTIIYWAVEHRGSDHATDIIISTTNSVFVVSNLLVSGLPVRLLHAIYPIIYSAIYVFFTLIYYLSDATGFHNNKEVFPGIDWNKAFPTTLVIAAGLILVLPFCHLMCFSLFTLRVFLYGHCGGSHCKSYSFEIQETIRSTQEGNINNTSGKEGQINPGFQADERPVEIA